MLESHANFELNVARAAYLTATRIEVRRKAELKAELKAERKAEREAEREVRRKAEPDTPWCHSGPARGGYAPRGYPKRPCMGVCNLDEVQKSRGPLKLSRAGVENI